jgi:hypothetical protein
MLKPRFKYRRVRGSAILQRRENLSFAFPGDDINAFEFPAADSAVDFLAAFCPSVFALQELIYSCYVNVNDVFFGAFAYSFVEFSTLFFISLDVDLRLFFRVIFSFLSATRIECSAQPNSSAISCKYAS